MIGGWYGYAAIGVVVAGLGLGCYALYERGNAATAKLQAAEERNAQLTVAVQESEAENAALKVRAKVLDDTIANRDKRIRDLLKANGAIKGELDAIKKTLPAEDVSCLDRPLPGALRLRLN